MNDWGKGVSKSDIHRLQELLEERALLRDGEFTLSSGKRSNFYFNSKPVTLSGEGLYLLGHILAKILRNVGAQAVGGLELGAVPLALEIARQTHEEGDEIPAFVVRRDQKAHGTKELITASYLFDEPPGGGTARRRVVIVDDVITTGKSVEQAIEAVRDAGREIAAIVVLVTRPEDGGVLGMQEKFRSDCQQYISLFDCASNGSLRSLVADSTAVAV